MTTGKVNADCCRFVTKVGARFCMSHHRSVVAQSTLSGEVHVGKPWNVFPTNTILIDRSITSMLKVQQNTQARFSARNG